MASLQVSHHIIINNISRKLFPEPLQKSTVPKHSTITRQRNNQHFLKLVPRSVGEGGNALVQQRPPSKDEELSNVIDQMAEIETSGDVDIGGVRKEEIFVDGCLVREYGWKVRRMVENDNEIRQVARVQAQAFHAPAFVFDDFFFNFFQAEVLAGLLYRLRNSPPDRYACLVAEEAKESDDTSSTNSDQLDNQQLVGVVDVTVLRDNDVLEQLKGGAQEYLYVSGIAVSNYFRRQKVATALLKACEVLSVLWGYEYLALRAYEEDRGARELYTNAGYRVVCRDSPWVTLIGRKIRVLMVKRLW